MAIASTSNRVAANSSQRANEKIHGETERNIAFYSRLEPAAIDRRLVELDHEWDVERMLETNAASVTLASFVLGAVANRKWFALSGLVGCFLLQHAIQGWCPPLPLIRAIGFRTANEIAEERHQLLRAREAAR